MDIATIIGFIGAVVLLVWSIMLGAPLAAFVDVPSVIMVFGGGAMTLLISFPMSAVPRVVRVYQKTVFTKPRNVNTLIEELVRYAEVARRDGILALENVTRDIKDPFLLRAIQMAVDGTEPELLQAMLTEELEALAARHGEGKAILDNLGKYAPAYGMIGTLVGLVIMLKNMDDPSKIGPGMAVALLTTLYGAVIANMFCLPFAEKLALRSGEELFEKSVILKGILSIQAGDNPRIVEQKLYAYLPYARRKSGQDEGAKEAA